jgi:hypothetical protein
MKTEKNYFVRENRTDLQYFCQLQVSNKFRKSMNAYELELCNWMVQQLVHRTVTEEGVLRVLDAVERRVRAANDSMEGTGSYLLLSYSPLRKDESGFIRIERTAGRHQNVLLPIIDCRGSVDLNTGRISV